MNEWNGVLGHNSAVSTILHFEKRFDYISNRMQTKWWEQSPLLTKELKGQDNNHNNNQWEKTEMKNSFCFFSSNLPEWSSNTDWSVSCLQNCSSTGVSPFQNSKLSPNIAPLIEQIDARYLGKHRTWERTCQKTSCTFANLHKFLMQRQHYSWECV